MPTMSAEELKEGMVTEEAVLDGEGNVVLREGIKLTGNMISALRHRRVTRVAVAGEHEQDSSEHDSQTSMTEDEKNLAYYQIDEKIAKIFEGQKDPQMLELAEAAKRYHKSKIR